MRRLPRLRWSRMRRSEMRRGRPMRGGEMRRPMRGRSMPMRCGRRRLRTLWLQLLGLLRSLLDVDYYRLGLGLLTER
jgi:hypothetical protein